MLTYFGRVRFKGRIPGGLVAVALGTLLAWVIGIAPVGAAPVGRGAAPADSRVAAICWRRSAADICCRTSP